MLCRTDIAASWALRDIVSPVQCVQHDHVSDGNREVSGGSAEGRLSKKELEASLMLLNCARLWHRPHNPPTVENRQAAWNCIASTGWQATHENRLALPPPGNHLVAVQGRAGSWERI